MTCILGVAVTRRLRRRPLDPYSFLISVVPMNMRVAIPVAIWILLASTAGISHAQAPDAANPSGGDSLLVRAVIDGETDEVRRALRQGANPNARYDTTSARREFREMTPLHTAAFDSREEIGRILLNAGADPDARAILYDPSDRRSSLTALHIAVSVGVRGLVDELLAAGADPNAQILDTEASSGNTSPGPTPIILAAISDDPDIAQRLIDAGADANVANEKGNTALDYSIRNGSFQTVDMLLSNGASVKGREIEIAIEAMRREEVGIIKRMIEQGADLSGKMKDGRTLIELAAAVDTTQILSVLVQHGSAEPEVIQLALRQAVTDGSPDAVRALLEAGADPTALDEDGMTLLMHAADRGREDVVALLLEEEVDPNRVDEGGQTAITYALEADHQEIAERLLTDPGFSDEDADLERLAVSAARRGNARLLTRFLDRGVSPDMRTERGWSLLLKAIHREEVGVVQALLDAGASPLWAPGDDFAPLVLAATQGNREICELLIGAGADLDQRNPSGQTPLMRAARHEQEKVLDLLLSSGASVNAEDDSGETAVFAAARNGKALSLQHLIAAGANLNRWNRESQTALGVAIVDGNVRTVEVLINGGADPNQAYRPFLRAEPWASRPIIEAVRRENRRIAEVLLDRGADPTPSSTDGETALHLAASRMQVSFVRRLVEAGADVAAENEAGETPLAHAACKNRFDTVELLLEVGADVNHGDQHARTPLVTAISCGSSTSVRYLLRADANPNTPHRDGQSPLEKARQKPLPEAERLLISHGVDPEEESVDPPVAPLRPSLYFDAYRGRVEEVRERLQNGTSVYERIRTSGATGLHGAADGDHPEITRILLDAGADPNARDDRLETPLMEAAKNASISVIPVLVASGASTDLKTEEGETALQMAARKGNVEAVQALVDANATVAARSDNGWTPLHAAAYSGHTDVIKVLLENGVPVNVRDNEGRTPLFVVSDSWEEDALSDMQMLLDAGADPNAATEDGRTPLQVLAEKRKNEAGVHTLLDAGADPNGQAALGWQRKTPHITALHQAAAGSSLGAVEALLRAGARVDARGGVMETPLMLAARQGHTDIITSLLDRGAEVNAANVNGVTPLVAAAEQEHASAIKTLLDRGAQRSVQTEMGETALDLALRLDPASTSALWRDGSNVTDETLRPWAGLMVGVARDDVDMAKQYLNEGAEPSREVRNQSALLWSVRIADVSMTRWLLEAGAVVEVDGYLAPDDHPLTLAIINEKADHVRVMLEHGMDPNFEVDFSDASPLILAVETEDTEMVRDLLESGADPHHMTDRGRTVLDFARRNQEIRGLLQQAMDK